MINGGINKVNICYAVDEKYTDCLKVSMYSLLKNRNREVSYEIIVINSNLPKDKQEIFNSLIENESDVSIRFVDVSDVKELKVEASSYLSAATYYRLYLLSEEFASYDRILYIDCDTVTEKDVSSLFFSDLEGQSVAAVEEISFRQLSMSKKAVFIDGRIPYNVDNYRRDALLMKHPESYFNAGVMLFDLKKCRLEVNFEDATKIYREKQYYFNDQDVLNILFDGRVKLLDYEWNYQNYAEALCKFRPEIYREMYADVIRSSPSIIHYVGHNKPWNIDVELGEIYHRYEKEIENEKA